jgi:hypothetical protein
LNQAVKIPQKNYKKFANWDKAPTFALPEKTGAVLKNTGLKKWVTFFKNRYPNIWVVI